jgi:hypothetical protein
MRHLFLGSALLGLAALTYWALSASDPPGGAGAATAASAPAGTAVPAVPAGSARTWGPSPFAIGAPVLPDQARTIAARKERMHARGIDTPDAYYAMGIAELDARAAKHDVAALLQLGERYWSEAELLPYDGASNLHDAPQALAIGYFLEAARSGSVAATATIADRLTPSGDIVEAAAWNMVANRLNQQVDTEAAARRFGQKDYQQRERARQRAEFLLHTIGGPLPM